MLIDASPGIMIGVQEVNDARFAEAEKAKTARALAGLTGSGKRDRKPSRDDIARALLHWSITGSAAKGQMETLLRVEDEIVARLVWQGLDEGKAYEVFDNLIERYTRQRWEFRAKCTSIPPLLRQTAFACESRFTAAL